MDINGLILIAFLLLGAWVGLVDAREQISYEKPNVFCSGFLCLVNMGVSMSFFLMAFIGLELCLMLGLFVIRFLTT